MANNSQKIRQFLGAITLIALAIIITTLAPLATASSPTAINPERPALVTLEQPSVNHALSPDSQQLAQGTSGSRITDVSPSDHYYSAVQNLVQRYRCIQVYPDGTYRGEQPLTRGDFAVMMEGCLNRVLEMVAATMDSR
jgi:hypothetical protein